jgi:hypothetical protein
MTDYKEHIETLVDMRTKAGWHVHRDALGAAIDAMRAVSVATSTSAEEREHCKAVASKMTQDAMMRVGNPVDTIMNERAVVRAESAARIAELEAEVSELSGLVCCGEYATVSGVHSGECGLSKLAARGTT